LLNIAINLVLIPRYHAIGSAFATLVTQWVVALLHIVAAQRQFGLKNNYPLLLRITGFALVLVVLGWITTLMPWSYKLLLPAYVLLATIVAVMLRLFDINAALALVRSRRAS
jgi:O-antigen/teichoic acid export membrane protein